jgi:hypothetical protein
MLGGAAAMVALFRLNAGVTRLLPYLLTGEYCGFSCFSQAHATVGVSGVLIPLRTSRMR